MNNLYAKISAAIGEEGLTGNYIPGLSAKTLSEVGSHDLTAPEGKRIACLWVVYRDEVPEADAFNDKELGRVR